MPCLATGARKSCCCGRRIGVRFEIRTARAADLAAALRLLRMADLPTEDLLAQHLALVAHDRVEMLGVIGMQPFDKVALLRSLVVAPGARGASVGRQLVQRLEMLAEQRGINELWLLTIDADGFFLSQGFCVRDRNAAPEVVRNSKEFSTLCPGNAVLMSKRTGVS